MTADGAPPGGQRQDESAMESMLSLLYQCPIAVARLSESGQVTLLNAQVANLLMQLDPPPDDLSNLFSVLAPVAPELPALVAAFRAPCGTICDNLELVLPTGGARALTLVVTLTLVKIEPGSLMMALVDVSRREHERRRLERQRGEREEELALVQRIAHLGYVSVDPARGVVTCSDELYRLLGLEPGAPLPSREELLAMVAPEDLPLVSQLLSFSSCGAIGMLDVRVRPPGGPERTLRIYGGSAHQSPGLGRLLFTVLDVTEQELRERDLRRARDQAQAAMRTQREFLTNMSHELRTPLSGILGTLDHVLRPETDPSLRGDLDRIRGHAEALLRQIDSLLSLSEAEEGQLRLQPEAFHASTLVQLATEAAQARGAARGLALELSVDPRLPALLGDLRRLSQVLAHLTDNAEKFTRSGRIAVCLHGEEFAPGKVLLRVTVQDSGCGIAPEQLGRIFSPFTQGDGSMARRHGGTGVGLALCRRLVGLMGGAMGVDSRPGEGSLFWFSLWLPVAYEADAAPPSAADQARPVGPGRVLIVEDERTNQLIAERMLQKLELQSDIASNGREALELVARTRYDAVLMDCQMPEMDGFEATRRIRAGHPDGPPIIALTAHALAGERERCLQAGMDDFLTKPVRLSSLSYVLRYHMQRQAQRGRRPGQSLALRRSPEPPGAQP